MRKRGKDIFFEYLGKKGLSLWIAIFFLILGISIGAFSEKMMGITQKNELLNYVSTYFNIMHLDNISNTQIFLQSLTNNYKILGIIFLSGAAVIGFPITLLAITFKGITIGFVAAFFMEEMKLKGLALAFSSILPQNLIFVPALIFAAAVSIGFSFNIISRRGNIASDKGYLYHLSSYLTIFAFVGGILFIGCLIESYICPFLIKIIISV